MTYGPQAYVDQLEARVAALEKENKRLRTALKQVVPPRGIAASGGGDKGEQLAPPAKLADAQ